MILETTRLRLEPFAPEHASGLCAINSDPKVMRDIGPLQSMDDVKTGIARMAERWARLGYAWWAVIEKYSGDVVGAACMQDTGHVPGAPLEIGWRLTPAAQGKGYATEAGQAAVDFAFGSLDANLVLAVAKQDNVASHKVMQRLGMTYRGIETHYGLPLTTYVRIRTHNQNMTVAARAIADRKTLGQRS